jgi:hypothetical protein
LDSRGRPRFAQRKRVKTESQSLRSDSIRTKKATGRQPVPRIFLIPDKYGNSR